MATTKMAPDGHWDASVLLGAPRLVNAQRHARWSMKLHAASFGKGSGAFPASPEPLLLLKGILIFMDFISHNNAKFYIKPAFGKL